MVDESYSGVIYVRTYDRYRANTVNNRSENYKIGHFYTLSTCHFPESVCLGEQIQSAFVLDNDRHS